MVVPDIGACITTGWNNRNVCQVGYTCDIQYSLKYARGVCLDCLCHILSEVISHISFTQISYGCATWRIRLKHNQFNHGNTDNLRQVLFTSNLQLIANTC